MTGISFRQIVLGHRSLSKTTLPSTILTVASPLLIIFASTVFCSESGKGDQLFVRLKLGFSMCRWLPWHKYGHPTTTRVPLILTSCSSTACNSGRMHTTCGKPHGRHEITQKHVGPKNGWDHNWARMSESCSSPTMHMPANPSRMNLEILEMFQILGRIWCKAWWPGLIRNLYLFVAIFSTVCYKNCMDLGFNTNKLIIF